MHCKEKACRFWVSRKGVTGGGGYTSQPQGAMHMAAVRLDCKSNTVGPGWPILTLATSASIENATVRPIPLYHVTGGSVYGSQLFLLRTPTSHCPSYPTVPWDRQHCLRDWKSTVPPQGSHIPLFILSHCIMGQVGLLIGVHCPIWGPPYPILPIVLWDRWNYPWDSTIPPEGPHVPIPLYIMGQVGP